MLCVLPVNHVIKNNDVCIWTGTVNTGWLHSCTDPPPPDPRPLPCPPTPRTHTLTEGKRDEEKTPRWIKTRLNPKIKVSVSASVLLSVSSPKESEALRCVRGRSPLLWGDWETDECISVPADEAPGGAEGVTRTSCCERSAPSVQPQVSEGGTWSTLTCWTQDKNRTGLVIEWFTVNKHNQSLTDVWWRVVANEQTVTHKLITI